MRTYTLPTIQADVGEIGYGLMGEQDRVLYNAYRPSLRCWVLC